MPRRRLVRKREINPDSKHSDLSLAKLINIIMKNGKKSISEKIVYGSFSEIQRKTKENAFTLFNKAIENLKPILEVKSRRVGGATYQVPVDVPERRQLSLAIRWLVEASNARNEKTMIECLANEIIDASKNTGLAVKKKDDIHRMAEANKIFAHLRW